MSRIFYDMIDHAKREGLILPLVLFASGILVLFYELFAYLSVNI